MHDPTFHELLRYKDVFDEGLGCFTDERARLRVRPDAVPVFCRARPIPYALRARVDAELDAMLATGVIEPVDHSDWATPLDRAFNEVKRLLVEAPVLAHYDPERDLVLTCDAGPRGIGAVLATRGNGAGGRERVLAYASRALTPPEINYSQIHKEALAIIFAVKKFHQYIYGRRFVLRTDHKPLVSIFGPGQGIPSMTASRMQRWALILSAYDFDIEYVKSDDNTADALSRLIAAHKATGSGQEECPEQTYLHFATNALLLDYNNIRKETHNDILLSRVLSYIRDGWPQDIEIRELKPFYSRKAELYLELDCIMWGHRVIIPSACRERVLKELHDSHMGMVKTKALARSYVWWPGLDEAVERVCRACEVCAAVAAAPPRHVPCPWPYPSRPWSRVHVDFLGPISGTKYLVLVDAYSKWIEVTSMSTTTAKAVLSKLREHFARFGLPKQIVSDNGPPFASEELQAFCKQNGIEQLFSAPYHPASNGLAENAVKLCKRVIKKAIVQVVNVDAALSRFLLVYRNTPHNTTGDSPAQVLLGRPVRTRLDCLKPDREKRVNSFQRQHQATADGKPRSFNVDELVWFKLFNTSGPNTWGKGKVLERMGETDYRIETLTGIMHRHIDQLRKRDSSGEGIAQRKNTRIYPPSCLPVAEATEHASSSRSGEREGTSDDNIARPAPDPNQPAEQAQPGSPATERVRPEPLRPVVRPPVRYGWDV
ncbi:uncharacterized protein K02A2.6-like [Hyposmocoma kahamanoa]|uniref:uncharacterized protein K02A2.6-like n=1 Tax=Hyposmocoma kahamanoa TaxID=1477025 RepID=UPI000E6D7D90|nr:uncharacterized protein K02A2.6-like [Hyposmocoma kahamanoa]